MLIRHGRARACKSGLPDLQLVIMRKSGTPDFRWHPRLHDIAAGKTWMAGINPAMTLRVNPAMTSGALHAGPFPSFQIHFSNSPSSVQASSPVFFVEAPGRPVSFSSLTPRHTRGMARQVAQPLFVVAALPLESTGASRRAITAFSLRHRAALFAGRFHFLERPCVSQLLAGGSYWPPGGAPAPPGCVLLRKARARAPHPIPPA